MFAWCNGYEISIYWFMLEVIMWKDKLVVFRENGGILCNGTSAPKWA
jgi:hypothetical protein